MPEYKKSGGSYVSWNGEDGWKPINELNDDNDEQEVIEAFRNAKKGGTSCYFKLECIEYEKLEETYCFYSEGKVWKVVEILKDRIYNSGQQKRNTDLALNEAQKVYNSAVFQERKSGKKVFKTDLSHQLLHKKLVHDLIRQITMENGVRNLEWKHTMEDVQEKPTLNEETYNKTYLKLSDEEFINYYIELQLAYEKKMAEN